MMNNIALALDLGGTNIRLAAIGEDGTVFSRSRAATPKRSSANEIVELIVTLANQCRNSLEDPSRVFAIAAAVPATIDEAAGILNKLPNLPALEGIGLRDVLSEKLGIPTILENDANAAAYGENWLGASRGVDDSICITLGTGVGGGLTINGRPFRGKDGTAGELGHVCVEPQGVPCGCGGRGCMEQYASATAIVRMAREAGMDVGTSYEVYIAAVKGDEAAAAVLRLMGSYLGIGISSLINVLNPEMVVISGGVSAAWEQFIGPVQAEISVRSFRQPAERANIVRAKLGDDAGILGAARSAFELLTRSN
ncbi:MAG: ROK family protein [Acidobacteriota bacterium]